MSAGRGAHVGAGHRHLQVFVNESQLLADGSLGVEMPKVLRTVKPGQYVLLPFEPPDDILCPPNKAA